MEWLQAAFLGVLQGLTEFLPISSSAHLRIFPAMMDWPDPGASFTAVIQIGTELAVLIYFAKDLFRIARAWTLALFRPDGRGAVEARLGWFIIVGSLPIGILGLLFEDQIQTVARNLWLIAGTLIVLGVILGIADRVGTHEKPIKRLNLPDALLYGAAQACALVPGVSRSGATISMGLFLGYERAAATRYAFLLAIPAVVAAGIFQIPDAIGGYNPYTGAQTVLATVLAFVVGYAAIAWLLRYVATHSYLPFVVYRIVLGLLVVGLLAAGVLEAESDITLAVTEPSAATGGG